MTTYTRPVVNGTPTTAQTIKAAHINEPVDFLFDTVLAGGITADQLAALSVTAGKIGTDAVITAKIQDAAVTGAKFNSNAVDDSTIELSSDQLQLKDDGITAAKLNSALDTVKAWGKVTSAGAISGTGFNITSANRDSTGVYTITWGTDFADTDYAVAITYINPPQSDMAPKITTQLAGSVVVTTQSQGSGPINSAFMISAFGDQ